MNIWNRMKNWWWRHCPVNFPSLVWRRDECEVLVAFDLSKVTLQQVFKVEAALAEIGVHFDRGAGGGERHWEWDYSLDGPITVRFKRRGKRNIPSHV